MTLITWQIKRTEKKKKKKTFKSSKRVRTHGLLQRLVESKAYTYTYTFIASVLLLYKSQLLCVFKPFIFIPVISCKSYIRHESIFMNTVEYKFLFSIHTPLKGYNIV